MRATRFSFLAACTLAACGDGARQQAADGAPSPTSNATNSDYLRYAAADCGAVAPLLRVLPATKAVDGLPERYRTCEPGEYAVMVGYQEDAGQPSEYQFRVQLLRGDSPYAENAVNPPGATDEQRAFLREAITRVGEMYQTRLNLCRNYARNPTIPGSRNPTLAIIKGVEVCFSDDLAANREAWRATASQNNLGFELQLTGAKAAAIATTAEAQARLAALFEGFLIDEAAQ